MEVLIKTILGETNDVYLKYLENLLLEEREDIITDQEKEMLKYLKETYEESNKFPSEHYFTEQFPEYMIPLESAEGLSIHDLDIHFKKMVTSRSKKEISRKLMKVNSQVSEEGFTDDIKQEIDEIYKLNREVDLDDFVFDIGHIREIYERKKDQPTGLLTFIDEVDEKIGGLNWGTVNVFFGFTGAYKCISENERVPTSKGLLKMKEIYNRHQDGEDFKVLSEEGSRKIKQTHDEGEKKSYKIKTKLGNEIETSPVHRFRIINEKGNIIWKQAQNIENGDKIILYKGDSVWGKKEVNLDYAYLCGILLGDGSVFKNKSKGFNQISISGSKKDYEEIGLDRYFNKCFLGYYNKREIRGRKDGYETQLSFTTQKGVRNVVSDLYGFMINKKSYNKELPEWVFKSTKDNVSSLLRGLFDADGSVSKKGDISFTSTSKNMIYDMSRLLRNYGMRVSMRRYKFKDNREYYVLRIVGLESRRIFMNEIGFSLERKVDRVQLEDSVNNREIYPNIREILLDFCKEITIPRELSYTFMFRYRDSNLTKKNLESIKENYPQIEDFHPTLKYLYNHDVYIDEVVDKEESKCYMYDLTVKGSPTYVVNQFITHNTMTTTNIAYKNSYELGYNVVIISLEVPKEDIIFNILSRHSYETKFGKYPYIGHEKIRRTLLDEEEESYIFDEVLTDLENNSEGELVILDETDFSAFTFPDIRKRLESVDERMEGGIDAVVWDHANLFKFSDRNTSYMSQYDIINEYVSFIRGLSIKWLKDVETGEYRQLCNIIVAQANRQGWKKADKNGGRYNLTAISGANELERAAYRVFSLYANEELKQSKEALIQILKNRSGPTMYEPASFFVDPVCYVTGDEIEGFNDVIDSGSFSDAFEDDLGI